MKVVYVCGYGRSGSTLLGRLLAARAGATVVGEATNLSSQPFLSQAVCSCGSPYPTCEYWASVHQRLLAVSRGRPVLSHRRRQLLEGLPGLFVPEQLLRRAVDGCVFSDRYANASFVEGVRVLAETAGGTFVDTSKTTRLTANRPRLLRAAGLEVELHVASRPWREIVKSYASAHRRRGRGISTLKAIVAVTCGRALSSIAALWCARSLQVSIPVTPLATASVTMAPNAGMGLQDHLIAGNRSRHLSIAEGAARHG